MLGASNQVKNPDNKHCVTILTLVRHQLIIKSANYHIEIS